ncbi:MAG: hypothetical protein AMXMBFR13_33120 [Phycisphaerae bacterium]
MGTHTVEHDTKPVVALEPLAAPGDGVIAALAAWLLTATSVWYLYWDAERYPAAAKFWCPSGRWGSDFIETDVYMIQPLRFLGVWVAWRFARRGLFAGRVARLAVLCSIASWTTAMLVLHGCYKWDIGGFGN